jgi:protein-disulfide isomerase
MSITRKDFLKYLGLSAAVIALGPLLAACGDDDPAKKAENPPVDKPADTPSAEKPAETAVAPKADGSVDAAKLMAPGPLPDVSIGKADAPVTIVEYMSMTCPHCAAFHNDAFEAIKEKYVDTGKVRFILREFPLDARAMAAIMVARCAPEGQYFPMVSALFKSQGTWAVAPDGRAALLQMAKLAGFTQESFEACLTNQKLLDDVTKVREQGSKEFGVDSTPTFFVNGQRYAGGMSVAEMSAIIDAAAK